MAVPYIAKSVPLADLTTFRIGGPADLFCEPKDTVELAETLKYVRENNCRYYILGGGSNTLFSDSGFRGMVIAMKSLKGIRRDGDRVFVLAGTTMDELNAYCSNFGLSGLEFSGGLPGSAGGAVYMNARAYHHEMSEVVKRVSVLSVDGQEKNIPVEVMGYGYKQSIFMKNPSLIITEIEFQLKVTDTASVRALTDEHIKDRENKGQYAYPSAGCVFKNDHAIGVPSGKLIESVGMKGKTSGGASVYERHANFIVNKGGAKAEDVVTLIREVEDKVFREKGVKLEREVRVIE